MFQLNYKDFTNCIVVDSYQVNETDVTLDYTDANGEVHKQFVRTKVEGTFDMYFRNTSLQDDFLDELSKSRLTGRYHKCVLYVNNRGYEVSGNFFLTMTPARTIVGNQSKLAKFTVKVEEK